MAYSSATYIRCFTVGTAWQRFLGWLCWAHAGIPYLAIGDDIYPLDLDRKTYCVLYISCSQQHIAHIIIWYRAGTIYYPRFIIKLGWYGRYNLNIRPFSLTPTVDRFPSFAWPFRSVIPSGSISAMQKGKGLTQWYVTLLSRWLRTYTAT